MSKPVKKGDKYVFDPEEGHPLFIKVTRVARDQAWADITVLNWACMWTKRQPLPIPAEKRDWTWDDVRATADPVVAGEA